MNVCRTSRGPWFWTALAVWAVSTATVLGFRTHPKSEPIIEDEIYWIGSAYYYELAFVRHDVSSPDWQLLPARENPPVAKYAVGLGLHAAGQHVTSPDLLGCFYLLFESVPGAWGEGADHDRRAAVVNRMTPSLRERLKTAGTVSLAPELLVPARATMILLAALTSLAVFLLAAQIGGNIAALLASEALLFHPIVTEAYNHALSDGVALFFSAAAALALWCCIKAILSGAAPRSVASRAVLTGTLMGLACGAKMNALVIPLLGTATFAAVALRAKDAKRRAAGWAGVATLVAAFAVFVAINPAAYQNVASGVAATVTEHRRTEAIQARFLAGRLVSLPAKLAEASRLFGFAATAWVPFLLLAGCGFASRKEGYRYVAAWWLIAWAAVTWWIPFSRLRYAAPAILPSVLLCALWAEWLVVTASRATAPRFRFGRND